MKKKEEVKRDTSEMLKVQSIFESISGEAGGFRQGTWMTFIRLYGCNLQCVWCDTKYANDKEEAGQGEEPFQWMSIDEISALPLNKHILITGGEPLYQHSNLVKLIQRLLKLGHRVQVETNGSLPIPSVIFDDSVEWVMDFKCPSSGMSDRMLNIPSLVQNINNTIRLGGHVCTKWVVADGDDLDFAIEKIGMLRKLGHYGPHIISPIDAKGDMIQGIVEIIRVHHEEYLDDITFSVQLHKLINMA